MASTIEKRMSRERAVELIDLVMEANTVLGHGYNIGFEIEKYDAILSVYQDKGDITYFSYTTVGKTYRNKNIMGINDPNLKKGEEHVRKLMDEVKEEKNDTV